MQTDSTRQMFETVHRPQKLIEFKRCSVDALTGEEGLSRMQSSETGNSTECWGKCGGLALLGPPVHLKRTGGAGGRHWSLPSPSLILAFSPRALQS